MNGVAKAFVVVGLGFSVASSLHAARSQEAALHETVGSRGNLKGLVFEGNKTFSAEAIKTTLHWDFDLLTAGHAEAPWNEFVALVRSKIISGYRLAGFADVRVEVRTASKDKLLVRIDEGPRYKNGSVEIIGTREISAKLLADRLTKPYWSKEALERGDDENTAANRERGLKKQGPIWTEGDTACFFGRQDAAQSGSRAPTAGTSPSSEGYYRPSSEGGSNNSSEAGGAKKIGQQLLESEVADALADLGYFFTRFDVQIVPDRRQRTAKLVINVREERPRATIEDIAVNGNDINSKEQIAKYLQIRRGQPCDRRTLLAMKRRLLDSGRFIAVDVRPLNNSPGHRQVFFDVKELLNAPPLDAPLSPTEDILMKFGRWFNDIDRWQGDMVIRIDGPLGAATIVVGPRRGILATTSLKSAGPPAVRPDYALIVAQDEIGLFSMQRRRKVMAEHLQSLHLVASLGIQVSAEADGHASSGKLDQRSKLTFGLGVNSESAPAFSVNMQAQPAAQLNDAHRPTATYTIRDGRLNIKQDDSTAIIDAVSGRLVEYAAHISDDAPPQGGKSGESLDVRVTVQTGEFERLRKQVHEIGRDYVNEYDSRMPLTSFCGLIADDEHAWNTILNCASAESADRARLARFLLDRRVVSIVEKSYLRASSGQFDFPFDYTPENKISYETIADAVQTTVHLALIGSDHCFRRDSWPWTVARELSLAFVGKSGATLSEMSRLSASDHCGPVGFLAGSFVLQYVDVTASRVMAGRGLERLALHDFREDYRALFDDHYAAGQAALELAAAFRDMPQEQLDERARFFGVEQSAYFREAVRAFRADRKRPLKDAAADFLDACWRTGLKEQIKSALEAASGDARPATNVL